MISDLTVHRLMLFSLVCMQSRDLRPHTKIVSDGEVKFLELLWVWDTPSLSLLSGPLELGMVVLGTVTFMGQIDV